MPAAQLLREGRLVAFPTETVYGLGANALDPDAVCAIFQAKGRPSDNPLIVHVADRTGLGQIAADIPSLAWALIDRFMPGPLTLVLPRSSIVPDIVTAGLDTVAVRIPEHPVARRLIELSGVPLAGPSANRSGKPSPTTAAHVLEDMDGIIPMIVDGGQCDFGLESTVLDVTGSVPVILRPGAVSAEEIMSVVGPVLMIDPAQATAVLQGVTAASSLSDSVQDIAGETSQSGPPRSPGMKYRHYAPRTPVRISDGPDGQARSHQTRAMMLDALQDGLTVAVFCSTETAELIAESLPAGWLLADLDRAEGKPSTPPPPVSSAISEHSRRHVFLIAHGSRDQANTAANRLFAALRQLDACGADVIIAESAEATGIGAAYVNRLRKAAGGGAEPASR